MIGAKEAEFFRENGYLLVKGVFNRAEVEELREAVESTLRKIAAANQDWNAQWQGDFLPSEELKKLVLKGSHELEYHDSAFTRAVMHPNIVGVLKLIIGPNVQLHHTKMLVKPPEKGAAFPMHQDQPYMPHTKHTLVAASVHLDDADLENGCIHVIPGSHKLGPIPHRGSSHPHLDPEEYPIDAGVPCPAEAGDVLFFHYLTIHGSHPNRSQRTRRNILFQYRDPEDLPAPNHNHLDWGQGLMICGSDPNYHSYRGKFQFDR